MLPVGLKGSSEGGGPPPCLCLACHLAWLDRSLIRLTWVALLPQIDDVIGVDIPNLVKQFDNPW